MCGSLKTLPILLANPQVPKFVCPTCLLGRQKSKDMGRHENIALGPSWTVVIFAQPSPLLHTVTASGCCRAPGRVAQFIGLCSKSKWSKHRTKSPFLDLR